MSGAARKPAVRYRRIVVPLGGITVDGVHYPWGPHLYFVADGSRIVRAWTANEARALAMEPAP